jgi:hypothetical protein
MDALAPTNKPAYVSRRVALWTAFRAGTRFAVANHQEIHAILEPDL